ncbi:hypothetical protein NVP1286O_73 [Vibrio phage 1.286.O._10N.286.55.C4]|nr:hypothetical protein NVP1286O_73 [Vibrio phage 1.286.O._10N.286.55.C4]
MIIKQASDLHFTYVRNTPELREAFINKCKEFGIRIFGFGGENYLEVYSDGYDEFEICGTDDVEPQSKKLTMSDLTDIPTETPEEKEVLDGIESTGEVEWKSGDLLEFMGEPCVFVSMLNGFPVVKYTEDADRSLAGCFDEIIAVDRLKKPETPQQREDRERACAIYDMCAEADIFTEESNFWAGKFYDLGYKKEKANGTN